MKKVLTQFLQEGSKEETRLVPQRDIVDFAVTWLKKNRK
jgi:aminoglycoside N3'-acetyltransferase